MTMPAPYHETNIFETDRNLQNILNRLQPSQAKTWHDHLMQFGAWVAGPLNDEAIYTDRHGRPSLQTYDRAGDIANQIIVNPAWQEASQEIYRRGIVGLNHIATPASHLITFAMGYMTSQSDVSLHCPATMTGAVAHILYHFAKGDAFKPYLHDLTRMDGQALSAGTWATEQHGGSDVGATTTTATRVHGTNGDDSGDHVLLNGLKWFTSNVAGGIAIATARPNGAPAGSKGLGLYLVPSTRPDGSPNPMLLRRLKDKLGTCGVPTAEVDLTDSFAIEIAPPPEGFKIMMEAIEFSRIHNAMSAIGLQRRALLECLSFAAERPAFGDLIINYPMVQDELLAMTTALEADMVLAFEAAHSFDQLWQVPPERQDKELKTWTRLCTALAKYQTAENANRTCRAAIELIGGNGYTYDYVTPRLLCDAQVLTVWEGPSNIQALEILRLMDERHGGFGIYSAHIDALLSDVPSQLGELAGHVTAAKAECAGAAAFIAAAPQEASRHARRLMAFMADILAAALLISESAHEDRKKSIDAARKALIARYYIEHSLLPAAHRRITPQAGWVYEHFSTIVTRS